MIAAPKPREPPVTSATLPASVVVMMDSFGCITAQSNAAYYRDVLEEPTARRVIERMMQVDRHLVATFRTADRLLRYIPTIYHQRFTCYELCHVR
jgi:hypothetical protein